MTNFTIMNDKFYYNKTTSASKVSRRSILKSLVFSASLFYLPASCKNPDKPLSIASGDDNPVAKTNTGKVRGYVDKNITVFKGIPYGADTASRRFMAPIPPEPWIGIRQAIHFGPRAPQKYPPAKVSAAGSVADSGGPVSEDCLYLNVWTPGLHDGVKRPVLVYIHGGGYVAHCANFPMYDGVNLCQQGDVVVVTLNHRLNAFGYLYLAELGGPEFADSGNVAQLDLVLALKWVRDNIIEFGGDPDRVTIFGQSGGGGKVACLMGMPSAMGLFNQAASSSGGFGALSKKVATQNAKSVLEVLGLLPDNIQQIRTVSMERLISASKVINYAPVVDGTVVPFLPFSPEAVKLSAHIPFMAGSNHDESRALIGEDNPDLFQLTWETLKQNLKKYFFKMGNLDLSKIIALYRRLYPQYSASDVFFGATTDSRNWRSTVEMAQRRAVVPHSSETFSYELDWGSPVDGGKYKACHGLDLALMFNNVALSNRMTGTGNEAYWLAEQMSGAYLAFARNGNPSHPKIPEWPPYQLPGRATMIFDVVPKIENDPRGEEREMFSEISCD